MEEENFVEYRPNIKKAIPLRDEALITGEVIVSTHDDIVNKKDQISLKFIQQVLEVGPEFPKDIKPGDWIMLDTSFLMRKELVERYMVILNNNPDVIHWIIPSRYVICKVELENNEENNG